MVKTGVESWRTVKGRDFERRKQEKGLPDSGTADAQPSRQKQNLFQNLQAHVYD